MQFASCVMDRSVRQDVSKSSSLQADTSDSNRDERAILSMVEGQLLLYGRMDPHDLGSIPSGGHLMGYRDIFWAEAMSCICSNS